MINKNENINKLHRRKLILINIKNATDQMINI